MARTRAVDYDEKRDAILKRSARIFADGGFERTSMSSVAAACGVSKPLLYHYYDSKDAILFDIIRGHLQELVDAVEAADDPRAEPEQRLRALVGALLDCYRDADAAHKVQINGLSSLPQDWQDELKGLERELVRVFADALKAAVPALDDGRLLKPVAMSLFGMLNWHYMWFRPEGPVSREEYADIATGIILNGARGLI
jgi:TetR/AcrR family transcriptional regulator